MVITGILAAVSAIGAAAMGATSVADLYSKLKQMKMSDETLNNVLLTVNNGSLTNIISKYIVEPVAIVSDDLKYDEITEKVMELNVNIFSSFYAQVFDILTKVNGVDAQSTINLLSTSSVAGSRVRSKLGLEDIDFDYVSHLMLGGSLSGLSVESDSVKIIMSLSTEANDKEDKKTNASDILSNKEQELRRLKLDKDIKEATKTAVGKGSMADKENKFEKDMPNLFSRQLDLEVVIVNKKAGISHTVVIPVMIKLRTIYTSKDNLLGMLKPNNPVDKSFNARYDEYRAGAISLFDLVFANDLIKEYKKNKIKDSDDLLGLLNTRTAKANLKSITGGGVGFEKFYNLFVVSKDVLKDIETAIRDKISTVRGKDKFLQNVGGLAITVVDQDYERVILYIKDIDGSTDVTYKALSKGKSKDADLSEILKALVNNRPPVI